MGVIVYGQCMLISGTVLAQVVLLRGTIFSLEIVKSSNSSFTIENVAKSVMAKCIVLRQSSALGPPCSSIEPPKYCA